MGYGSRIQRVPARGASILTDVDIFKVALLAQTERGVVDADGNVMVMSDIYSMSDFYSKCGGFNSNYQGSYIAKSFFDELDNGVNCELKVLSYVDSGSAQASYELMDIASSAVKIFDIKAGYKGLVDTSSFGNKVAIKTTQKNDITMNLTAEVITGATEAVLDGVDNLTVGNYIKFVDTATAYVKILTIVAATKTITFAALTLATTLAVATTVVSRQDIKLEVAVKDENGDYQKKSDDTEPFAQSDTIGLASVINDAVDGNYFITMAVNAANVSVAEDQIPADLTTWTPLAGGLDGSAATDSNWKTLAETYFESEEFTILLAPESASTAHNLNMLTFCTDGYKGIYYAQASDGASEDNLKNFGALLRGSVKFGMIPSDKWIKVSDPTTINGYKDIPMVGVAAAHWFNVYESYGESKVAAGNKAGMVLKTNSTLIDSNGLVHDDTLGVGARLIRNYSINISRFRRGKGITLNSARTFSTDDGYKFQNQLFQFILYSRSIVTYLQTIEQDRAGKNAQETHYLAVRAYMNQKYKAGHLFVGQNEDGSSTSFTDVCIIVNDFSINTLANIANGIEEIFLQFVAPVPIEEAILSLASAGVTSVKS